MTWSQQCAVSQEALPSMPFKLVLEKWLHAEGLELMSFVSDQGWMNYHTIQHSKSVTLRLLLPLLWACQSFSMDHSPGVKFTNVSSKVPVDKATGAPPWPNLLSTCTEGRASPLSNNTVRPRPQVS